MVHRIGTPEPAMIMPKTGVINTKEQLVSNLKEIALKKQRLHIDERNIGAKKIYDIAIDQLDNITVEISLWDKWMQDYNFIVELCSVNPEFITYCTELSEEILMNVAGGLKEYYQQSLQSEEAENFARNPRRAPIPYAMELEGNIKKMDCTGELKDSILQIIQSQNIKNANSII